MGENYREQLRLLTNWGLDSVLQVNWHQISTNPSTESPQAHRILISGFLQQLQKGQH